ncbi:MAG: hypothetical protein IPH96_02745 [Saprospiraceae bacterium]|nr:hypothetical protein [Saprospiraceae bacterium]
MNKLTHLTFILCLLTFSISAQITGTVFRDYNGDGLKGSLEPLVAGILVTAYNSSGVQCGTTQTTTNVASLNYTLTGCTGIVRIEFAMPAKIATMNLYPNSSSDFSSSNGGTYGSSVQFLSNGASGTANYAISNPEDYWNNTTQPNPGFIVPRYVNGTSASNTAEKGLVFVDNNDNGLTPVVEEVANLAEVGSVWGTAFQRSRNRMFYSAFTKRHVGFGPEGEGGIYISDGTSMTNYSITGSFTLQGVTPSNGGSAIDLGTVTRNSTPGDDNYLIADKTQPSRDLDAFAKVGRTSYGDADFDEATQKLYIVNLNQRTIIEVDASGTTASLNSATPAQLGALTRSFSIASLPGVPSCTNGTLRPFALKIYRGKGYLGVICDASTSQNKADLSGYVLQFDLANIGAGFTTVISLPNFNTTTWRNNDINIEWKPWITNWAQTGRPVPTGFVGAFSHTQPVLSDIEFDEKGGLSMNLMSLWGIK